MKHIFHLINVFLIFTLFSYSLHAAQTSSVVDDSGFSHKLKKPATRIISLSPGSTELIFAAGGGDYLKGVVSYSDYPPEAEKLPNIGGYNNIDIERIVSLQPDLVVAWESGNPPLQLSKLRKLGVTVYVSELREFKDIPSTLIRLGILMGTEKTAEQAASSFHHKLDEIRKKYSGNIEKKSVFIQIWNSPVMSINGEHLISRVVAECGGKNIFHDYPRLTITPDLETVLTKNPDVIIASRDGKMGADWITRWKQWRFLNAVKNDQLFSVHPDYLVRHTPRVLKGIELVCEMLSRDSS